LCETRFLHNDNHTVVKFKKHTSYYIPEFEVVWEQLSTDDLIIVSGWVDVRTRRVYSIIENGVSHLKPQKVEGLLKQKNMKEILEKCQEYYVIEGKSLYSPMDTVAKFFDLDLRQVNIDYIKEFVPKAFISFEMTQDNKPHVHLMVAGTLPKSVQKHLKCLPNPELRDDARGGTKGFVGYLKKHTKPTCISSCPVQKEIDIRNIKIYLGHYFHYRRISGKKTLTKTYVVDGKYRGGSIGKCRSLSLKRKQSKKSKSQQV
jgi:hypothetical protein